MRVLIVDDNASMRQLLHSVLEGIAEIAGERDDGARAEVASRWSGPSACSWTSGWRSSTGIETRRLAAKTPGSERHHRHRVRRARLRDAAGAAGAAGYVSKDDLVSLRRVLGASRPKEKDR